MVKKLICIGIQYTDNNFDVTLSKCKTLAGYIKTFYEDNSRKQLQINIMSVVVKVPYTSDAANINKSVQYSVAKYPDYDLYVMVTNIVDVPHSGKGIAYLKSFLKRDGAHEVGHLLQLDHAGAYDDSFVLDQYGDTLSVMGRYASEYLTAPQYQFKGWTPDEELATYTDSILTTYTLKRVIDFKGKGLSAVMIPGIGRTAFISFPQGTKYYGDHPYLALHMQKDGGSQKVATFKTSYNDDHFTGLHIKVLSSTVDRITFSVERVPLPSATVVPSVTSTTVVIPPTPSSSTTSL